MHDVIIIGGSYAGLSAALQLGRARRSVLILDAGQRRNRFATSSHGFLGQDGQSPETIAAKGRAEVLAYPTVSWREAAATGVRAVADGFVVRAGDDEHRAKRLILATGVSDDLPPLPGLDERWGKTVFHCPYCHGYELDKGRIGVLATMPMSLHQAMLVAEWAGTGEMTFFLNGVFEPEDHELRELSTRGIRVEPDLVVAAEGEAPKIALRLKSGRSHELDGLFVASRTVMKNPFAEQLGCELETGPLGAFYKTDMMKETTVPGVFACGDVARGAGSLALAVADGCLAGVSAHRSLVFPREAA